MNNNNKNNKSMCEKYRKIVKITYNNMNNNIIRITFISKLIFSILSFSVNIFVQIRLDDELSNFSNFFFYPYKELLALLSFKK